MSKYFITGCSGFVSQHFLEYLDKHEAAASVLGCDLFKPDFNTLYENITFRFEKIDLLNFDNLEISLSKFQPDYILHLAAFSSVAYSWGQPVKSFLNNTNIYLNLLEAIRKCVIKSRILSIGSSEQYGNCGQDGSPITEEMQYDPVSPYAVARVSQELLSKTYINGFDLDIVCTRSFNHIGPYQKSNFVVASFIEKVTNAKALGKTESSIGVGNLDIVRDFTDVRDVVKAYHLLLKNGSKGEIYNVCSQKGIKLKQLLEKIGEICRIKIYPVKEASLIRPADNKIIIGSNKKIFDHIGWAPAIPIEKSLESMIESRR